MHKTLLQPRFGKGLIVPALIIGLTISYAIEAVKIGPVINATGVPEPAFIPILLAAATFVAMVPIVLRELFGQQVVAAAAKAPSLVNPTFFIMASIIYVFSFSEIGYFAATFFYSYAIISIFRFENGSTLRGQIYRIGASISIAVVVYLFFRVLFKVRLPSFMEGF